MVNSRTDTNSDNKSDTNSDANNDTDVECQSTLASLDNFL